MRLAVWSIVLSGLIVVSVSGWLLWAFSVGSLSTDVSACLAVSERRASMFSALVEGVPGSLPSCVLEYPAQFCEAISSKSRESCSGDSLCAALASRDFSACGAVLENDRREVCRAVLSNAGISLDGCRNEVALRRACSVSESESGLSASCKAI